jgi:hypothetical protein
MNGIILIVAFFLAFFIIIIRFIQAKIQLYLNIDN